ncbi:MAG: FAD-dependent oxidoreductase, partial [Lentisphaeria bacterium]|nr:FAD-dependent oxidoreductase [Lentisphaeria bacterium]
MAATWGAAAAAPGTLPVVYDVDVVVAGGGCGAVAAALAARRQGARVFLFTSRDYLGEDVAGVMQLWLEPGESPRGDLGQALFADPAAVPDPGLPFTYAAALPAEDRHPDTDPPSRLRRVRAARDPQHDSVQYGGDVVITAELAAPTRVQALEIISFTRSGDFEVRDVDVAVRLDGEEWEGIGRGLPRTLGGRATFRIPIGREIRQVRMSFRRAGRATRILLGSIAFLPEDPSRPAAEGMHVRPLHAKATLEGALLEAEIPFLFGCYAAEPLLDEAGGLGGLVMANRMGRQAVRAKVVVDATETAVVARSAGVAFEAPDTGGDPVRWVSIGSEPLSGEGVRCRALPFPVLVHDLTARKVTERPAHWYETTLTAEPPPDTWPERARWEQDLLDRICAPSQLLVADRPCAVSVRRIRGRSPGRGATAADVTLEACRPLGTDRLWVLGGCMDVPREEIGRLLRPVSILVLGGRVGAAAAAEAAGVALRGGVRVGGRSPAGPVYEGEVRELRDGLRPSQRHGVAQASPGPLPLLGTYDVVVVGGGTSGAAAGIAAARQGARTLVLEHLYGLGGVGTLGMIGKYWYGNRVGFAATVPENPLEVRLEFYRRELRKAGGEVWFGVLGCGAAVEGNRVTGVVVATPYGRGVVRAAVVIDGTGNADIAAVAGAETRFVEDFLALQQSHIPPREVGAS